MTEKSFAARERLDGEVVVITGGTGAIGAAVAARAARLGARVILLHRRGPEEASAVLATLPGDGHFAVTASVTDSAALNTAAAQVRRQAGNTSVLINCAGFTKPVAAGDLEGLTDQLIDDIFATNWRGTFAAIRAFAPQMKDKGDSVIVNVSSIAAYTGLGSNLAYAAAKAATDALGKGLAKTLAPQIRVLTVSPGVVDTGFVPGRDAAFNEKVGATIPLKRVGVADDVAAAVIACCTSLRYATGSVIVADGGRHLG
jgi:3-oxoacyl-[acyl-carrier protein] reductase